MIAKAGVGGHGLVGGLSSNVSPGLQPRRDAWLVSSDADEIGPSTKAGVATPARRDQPHDKQPNIPALNEGRGCNPGETGGSGGGVSFHATPQRRPGLQPRRDVNRLAAVSMDAPPSTKAGVATPARPRCLRVPGTRPEIPQRRPGLQPRRDNPLDITAPQPLQTLNEGRGCNPGETSYVPVLPG